MLLPTVNFIIYRFHPFHSPSKVLSTIHALCVKSWFFIIISICILMPNLVCLDYLNIASMDRAKESSGGIFMMLLYKCMHSREKHAQT